jgi:hypothetical protein
MFERLSIGFCVQFIITYIIPLKTAIGVENGFISYYFSLRVGWQRGRSSSPVKGKIFSSPRRRDRFWDPPRVRSTEYLGFYPQGWSGWNVKLTTHLQLEPKSRIRRPTHPLPHTYSWRSALLVKHRDNFTIHYFFPVVLQHNSWYGPPSLAQFPVY